MQSVLFLCHRLPWPPDKGDKIRSYHVLRRLAEHTRVYLGTFVDDPDDWKHVEAVKQLCAGTCIRPLSPWQVRRRAVGAVVRGEPVSTGCYRDRVLRRWVDRLIAAQAVDVALCYSSGVAPLVLGHEQLGRVMDFIDADSDKWQQYAASRHGLARLIHAREARRLAAFEELVARRFDASVFVSETEAEFFRARTGSAPQQVRGIANGVDTGYWDPARDFVSPYAAGDRVVVFAGVMDYRPNVDAVRWFVRKVWPGIVAECRQARFYIVGSRPCREVRALAATPGIVVTGRVEDVRPYLAHAHVVTTPLRIARGIQNKVLEALAMEKVVLASPAAWEGIEDFDGRKGCISDSPEVLAAETRRWLDHARPAAQPAARAMVREHYDWTKNLDAYEHLLHHAGQQTRVAPGVGQSTMEACP